MGLIIYAGIGCMLFIMVACSEAGLDTGSRITVVVVCILIFLVFVMAAVRRRRMKEALRQERSESEHHTGDSDSTL